jgi:chromosome segregation ATPase
MNPHNHLSHQRLLSLLVCVFSFATAGTSLRGQQVIQQIYPTYQQPSQYIPAYPSQPVQIVQPQYPIQQGPIIYGQPVPVQSGQLLDAPLQQPGVIFSPPIAQQDAAKADKAAILKQDEKEAKRLEQIERLEKVKLLIAENKRLEALVKDNGVREQEVQQLEDALRNAKLELSEMQKSASAKSADADSVKTTLNGKIQQQQNEIERLSVDYQTAVERNEALTVQVKTLSDESSSLKAQLNTPDESQAAMGMELEQLRANLTTTSGALDELKQKHAAVNSEYNRVLGLYESASADNANFSQRIEELTSENQRFTTQLVESSGVREVDSILNEGRIEGGPKSFATAGPVADGDLAVSDLKAKNQRLRGLNQKANRRIQSQDRRIAELEETVNKLAISDDDPEPATSKIASSFGEAPSRQLDKAGVPTGKYNVLSWLIPFLGIGLFVGLYVFLTEEYQGSSQALLPRDDTPNVHEPDSKEESNRQG